MRAVTERPIEPLELPEDRAHLHDRVNAQVGPRTVSRASGDLDLAPDEALVRHHQLQLGRLGHDRGVRADPAQHLLHAEARVLLVGDGGHDDVPGEPGARSLARRDQRGGDASLHVVGAPAVEPIALDPRAMRVGHAVDAHRVEVPAEHEGAAASRALRADDDARASGGLFEPLGLQPAVTRPPLDELGDMCLTGSSWNE